MGGIVLKEGRALSRLRLAEEKKGEPGRTTSASLRGVAPGA